MSRKPSEMFFLVAVGLGLIGIFFFGCFLLWFMLAEIGFGGVLFLGFMGVIALGGFAFIVALILYCLSDEREATLGIIRTMILYARRLLDRLQRFVRDISNRQ